MTKPPASLLTKIFSHLGIMTASMLSSLDAGAQPATVEIISPAADLTVPQSAEFEDFTLGLNITSGSVDRIEWRVNSGAWQSVAVRANTDGDAIIDEFGAGPSTLLSPMTVPVDIQAGNSRWERGVLPSSVSDPPMPVPPGADQRMLAGEVNNFDRAIQRTIQLTDDVSRTEYEVSTELLVWTSTNAIGSFTSQFCGLALNLSDSRDAGYLVSLRMDKSSGGDSYLSLVRIGPGLNSVSGSTLGRVYFETSSSSLPVYPSGPSVLRTEAGAPFNRWLKIRAEVSGARIRVFLGNESDPVLDYTDTSASSRSSGLTGIFMEDPYTSIQGTTGNLIAFFDQFNLTADFALPLQVPLGVGTNSIQFRAFDGDTLVSPTATRTIVREAFSREPIVRNQPLVRYGLGTLETASFMPSGVHVVSAGAGGAYLWNLEDETIIRRFSAPEHSIRAVAVSPDGTKLVTASRDKTAKVWDIATGSDLITFRQHSGQLTCVAFSKDGSLVATGAEHETSSRGVRLWNTNDGSVVRILSGHNYSAESLAFSPDNSKLLVGGGGGESTAILYDLNTGLQVRTLSDGVFGIDAVDFTSDGGTILTSGLYGSDTKLWRASTGSPILTLGGQSNPISSASFSPTDSSVIGISGTTATLWETEFGSRLRSFEGHEAALRSARWSSDGTGIVTTAEDNLVKTWEARSATALHTLTGHSAETNSVAFSPNGQLVVTGSAGGITTVWSKDNGVALSAFGGDRGPVNAVAFSASGGRLAAALSDGVSTVWDMESGAEVAALRGGVGAPLGLDFSPTDEDLLLTADADATVRLWRVESSYQVRSYPHDAPVTSVAFSPSGDRFVAGDRGSTATIWNLNGGTKQFTLRGHAAAVTSVVFSPDGQLVATGSEDYAVNIWDAATGRLLRTLRGETGYVNSLAFSPDSKRLLAGTGEDYWAEYQHIAILWDVATGNQVMRFLGHGDDVSAVAISPDGKQVLTGSRDGTSMLWDANTSIRERDKIIIVAGGGEDDNSIAYETRALADRAYMVSSIREVPSEDILYLSSFRESVHGDVIDGPATRQALESGLRDFAADARRLTVMMFDHGDVDSYQGRDSYYFYFDISPREWISGRELDDLLDEIQSGFDPLPDLNLYIDMCYAGGFVRHCSGAPPSTGRTVIASTAEDRLASYAGANADLSFSAFFLSSVQEGNTFLSAFNRASLNIRALNIPPEKPQLPVMDDDGDGVYTGADGGRATSQHLGRSDVRFASIPPEIQSISPPQSFSSPREVTLYAEMAAGTVDSVRIYVASDSAEYPDGIPITNLQTFTLNRVSGSRWEVTLPPSTFRSSGSYNVLYQASRRESSLSSLELFARSKSTTVSIGVLEPDLYEFEPFNDDSRGSTSNLLSISGQQRHTLHEASDQDWGIAYVDGRGTYKLSFRNMIVPAGHVLKFFVYQPGATTSYTAYSSSQAFEGALSIPLGSTVGFFEYQVRLCNSASPQQGCVDPDPLLTACQYTVALESSSAGGQGSAIQIDPYRVSVPIAMDDLDPAIYRGARIYRISAYDQAGAQGVLVPGAGDLTVAFGPQPCDCPPARPGLGSNSSCFEVIDSLGSAYSRSFDSLYYRVVLVRRNNSTEEKQGLASSGTFILGLDADRTTFCTGFSNSTPSIIITSPASDQSVPNATTTFAFSGTASDSDGSVASIRWRVNGGAFQ
ncbi:hypothetical protein GC173_04245, partial [bacterium]|nr:hypothetical protein [bacterium]